MFPLGEFLQSLNVCEYTGFSAQASLHIVCTKQFHLVT